MAQIQCAKCKGIAFVPDNWDRNTKCGACGGYFQEVMAQQQVVYPQQPVQQFQQQNPYNIVGNLEQAVSGIRENMPHIVLGKDGLTTDKNISQNKNQGRKSKEEVLVNNPPDKLDQGMNQIVKWVLLISVLCVVTYAAVRIAMIFFGF